MNTPRRHIFGVFSISAAASFLLCGYEFIRSVSTSLYIDAYGADRLPIVMALGPVGVAAVIYAYGRILSLVGPRRALLITSGFSAVLIFGCYLGIQAGFKVATGVAYVFREAYIVLIIEQYWSFINSTLGSREARVLNGPITGFASLGAVSGGVLVKLLAEPLGSEPLLLFAAGALLPAGLLSALAYRFGGEPAPSREEQAKRHGHLALGLFRSRYLLFIAFLIAATQIVSTVLNLSFMGLVEEVMPMKDERTAYIGGFYAKLNTAAFALQFFAAPILLRLFSLRIIHPLIPMIHLVASVVLIHRPSLRTGAVAFLLFKAFDYSIFRAGKELFYIPLSFDARYRAKEVIDVFVYRASKGGAGAVFALARFVLGKLPATTYPITAIGAAVTWLLLILGLTREHETLETDVKSQKRELDASTC